MSNEYEYESESEYEIVSVDELRRLLDCVNARYAELLAKWEPHTDTPEMRELSAVGGTMVQEIRKARVAKGDLKC